MEHNLVVASNTDVSCPALTPQDQKQRLYRETKMQIQHKAILIYQLNLFLPFLLSSIV